MMDRVPARLAAAAPWVLAAVGILFYVWAFYPGAMGFDTAYQWWQARGGETTNIHGLAMTWAWRLSDHLSSGPGFLFVLQLALFWTGLVLIAQSLRVSPLWRVVFLIAATAAPVGFVLFSSVVSDVMCMAVLTCALGILVRSGGGRLRIGLATAFLLLLVAIFLRKNALPAVFPLLVYIVLLWRRDTSASGKSLLRSIAIAVPIAMVMQASDWVLERTVDRQVTIFSATTLWDLAAMSLSANEILLPAASHGPGLTLDDLRQAFVPYANTTIFAQTHAGMRQPFFDPADPLNGEIRRAWIDAIRHHPRDYLAHRWRLSLALFGSKSGAWPHELVYFNGEYQYDGNPSVEPNTSDAHTWAMRTFEAMRDTVLLAAWPYLVLAFIACAVAWRRRGDRRAQAALAVLLSGLLYALPLPLVAPSAELRYLGWTCLSAILGAALALAISYDGARSTPMSLK